MISGKKVLVLEVSYFGTTTDANLILELNPDAKIIVGDKPLLKTSITLPVKILLTNLVTKNQTVNIYPNPTNGRLNLEGISSKAVQVIGLDGQIISTHTPNQGHINVSHLPNGIYLINYNSNGISTYSRFVKQN